MMWAKKLWWSLRLGLVSIEYWVWILALSLFFILIDLGHLYLAFGSVIAAETVFCVLQRIYPEFPSAGEPDYIMDPDLPVAENGKDLLDRADIINQLSSLIIRERPSVIALTGGYGDGKTSLLNLTIGQLRKRDLDQRPIIVKFSPWLPGNSSALVMSMLTSISAEIRNEYIVPGLSNGVLQYGKALLGMIPKAASFKDLFSEASQQEKIRQLTRYIARMPRRILVVLDDLDRMQPKELEVVFKILRGSEELSSVTFICSFDESELASILRSTRRYQNTTKFIKKFFQITVTIPKIDASKLKEFFQTEMSRIRSRAEEERR